MSYVEAIENITPTQARLHRERMERLRKMGRRAVADSGINLAKAKGVDGATFEKLRRLRREAAVQKAKQEASLRIQAQINAMVAKQSPETPAPEVVVSHIDITERPAVELSPLGSKSRVTRIQQIVCDRYGIELAVMLGKDRTAKVAGPRQIAMYLCRTVAQKSQPEIGRRFGGRDHTTVLHSIRKVEALMSDDQDFAAEIQGIISVIEQEA